MEVQHMPEESPPPLSDLIEARRSAQEVDLVQSSGSCVHSLRVRSSPSMSTHPLSTNVIDTPIRGLVLLGGLLGVNPVQPVAGTVGAAIAVNRYPVVRHRDAPTSRPHESRAGGPGRGCGVMTTQLVRSSGVARLNTLRALPMNASVGTASRCQRGL